MNNEANAHESKEDITLGPKFFELSSESREAVVAHENGHRIFDESNWLSDVKGPWWAAVDAEVFGKYNEELGYLEGINGQMSPEESTVEGIAVYYMEPDWLEEHWPGAYKFFAENL